MKVPNINLEEMKKFKEKNFKERLEFIEKYAEWVKSKSNKEWSSQQKELIDQKKQKSVEIVDLNINKFLEKIEKKRKKAEQDGKIELVGYYNKEIENLEKTKKEKENLLEKQ